MSSPTGEELDRILQPNESEPPSPPRDDPPEAESPDLPDEEEFQEKLRTIEEAYKNKDKNIQAEVKKMVMLWKIDEDDDDDDNESSSRRDALSTSAPKPKNTFNPTRRRSSDVFQRKSEEKSRKDDSDEDSDDGRERGLLKTVGRSRNEREGMRRGMVGTSRGSTSWREDGSDTLKARPSQRASESSRPSDTSRSRSRSRERYLSRLSPWRRNLCYAQEALIDVMVKQRRAKLDSRLLRRAPSDSLEYESLDAVDLDADVCGIVGQDSDDERLQSSKQRRQVPASKKIPRRGMEEPRIEAPNDSDEPMSDDDDKTSLGYLPSKFGGWRASKDPESFRSKPSEPTRITGNWDELPTSSGAAKTLNQEVRRPNMTDFFKPAPRPGQERRISDQPPHQEPLGFKELARMSKKLEKRRRELQLLNDEIEKKRAIQEEYVRATEEAERWRPKSPVRAPNDSDELMSDDDDETSPGYLPSKFGGWRASKESTSSCPKPSKPTRITGDWNELPTSSGAAKISKQEVRRPTMTDFFKPAPRPGQEQRIPDQHPHQNPLGFKKTMRMAKEREKKRRELQLLKEQMEKERAIQEKYARREKQEKRRRATEKAERWRPKSPVGDPLTGSTSWLSAEELDRLPSDPRDMPPYTSPELSDEEEFQETLRQIKEKHKNKTIQSETKEEQISRRTYEYDYDADELEFYERIRKIGEKYENERKNRFTHS